MAPKCEQAASFDFHLIHAILEFLMPHLNFCRLEQFLLFYSY